MAKPRMMAINMAFYETKTDEEGKQMFDKNGKPIKNKVYRAVRHNAMYIPR